MKETGKLIWITGLSGSGKTTISTQVYQTVKQRCQNLIHLDGDELRYILGETSSYGIEDRKNIAGIYARFCQSLTNQGINVLISAQALFHSVHSYNRKNNSHYYEIVLNVDKHVLVSRNKNGLYESGAENVMGIHQKPEFPKNPDLILTNNIQEEIEKNVNEIIAFCELLKEE